MPEEEVTLIRINGRLDSYTNDLLEEALEKLFSADHRRLLFDISEMRYINSTGLGTIIAAYNRALAIGGFVGVFGAQEKVAKVIRLTRVDRHLKLFASEQEALHAAAG
jgi:anti-sigma B factor antagonist